MERTEVLRKQSVAGHLGLEPRQREYRSVSGIGSHIGFHWNHLISGLWRVDPDRSGACGVLPFAAQQQES